jgi:hypothetical protein
MAQYLYGHQMTATKESGRVKHNRLYWMNAAWIAMLILSSCAKEPPPPPPPVKVEAPIPQQKPISPPRPEELIREEDHNQEQRSVQAIGKRSQFLVDLYQAHIFLTTFQGDQAIDSISRCIERLSQSSTPSPNQSSLLVEITILNHGTLTTFYIPLTLGEDRFRELQRALSLLRAKKLEVVDFKLVTYTFPKPNDPNAEAIIRQSLAIVNDTSIRDESYAFLTASRELSKFYHFLMDFTPYEGSPAYRLSLNYLAARHFFKKEYYEVARVALKQAERALSDYKLTVGNRDIESRKAVKQYAKKLKQLRSAVEQKDPSLLGKLDGWWNRVLKDQ